MNDLLPKAEPDFLQCLVSRALEDDSAIEPRLPSLFEPASVSSLDPGVAWQDEPAYVADQAVEGGVGDGDVEAGQPQAKAGPTPSPGHDVLNAAATPGRAEQIPLAEQPNPRPAAARALDAAPPPQPMPSSSQATAATRRRSSPAARSETAASAELLPPKAVDVVIRELHAPAGDVTPFEGRRLIIDSGHREESPPQAASRDRCGMDERTNPPERTDLDDMRGTLVPVSTAAALHIVVAPQAAPYRPPPNEAPAGQADAAPVVNVTIGRLEVRAMPAAATAKPRSERRGAQPMTLDDYFKQRRGER
jgi:hypothetical protein